MEAVWVFGKLSKLVIAGILELPSPEESEGP